MPDAAPQPDARDELRLLNEQVDALRRQHRRQLLLFGLALSLLAHLCIMFLLAALHRAGGDGGGGAQPVTLEFAIVSDEELTELDRHEFDDAVPEALEKLDELLQETVTSEIAMEAESPQLEIAAAGAMPTLGAAGGDGGGGGLGGLAGAGAGTSFFGIAAQGTRFAYIVDVSGSMGHRRKMPTAMRELGRSIASLPDYAHFHVVLFSSDVVLPPMQRGWTRARPSSVAALVRWLGQLTPGGGTEPAPAFELVFGLDDPPDVIYFLTDGQISSMNGEFVRDLNRRRRTVVHTVAFGDPASQDLLQQIARDSGGVYSFVPSDG